MKKLASSLSNVGVFLIIIAIAEIVFGFITLGSGDSETLNSVSNFVSGFFMFVAGILMCGAASALDEDKEKLDLLYNKIFKKEDERKFTKEEQVKDAKMQIFAKKENFVKNNDPEFYETIKNYYIDNDEEFKKAIIEKYESLSK